MPEKLRSHTMRYITEDRTFWIEKARERLGYRPVYDTEDTIREGLEWDMRERLELAGLRKN